MTESGEKKSGKAGLWVALGIVVVLSLLAVGYWGFLQIQKASRLKAHMELTHARFLATEDGPEITKAYAPGDDLYLVLDAVNVAMNDLGNINGQARFDTFDPSGRPIVETVHLDMSGRGPKEFGEPIPLRFHLKLPIYAVGGGYIIQVTVKDQVRGVEALTKAAFQVQGPEVASGAGLSVQDHAFLSSEEGPPVDKPNFPPGTKIRTRFHVVGFKLGADQTVKIRMDLGVMSEAGERLLDQPDVVNVSQKFFYPPVYLPITASVDTPPDMALGRYRILYVIHDDVAGTQITLEQPFNISPQAL